MRSILIFFPFVLCLSSFSIIAYEPASQIRAPTIKEPSELVAMQVKGLNDFIDATKDTLASLQKLQQMTVEYSDIQEQYLEHTQNRELLFRMTKKADEILDKIQSEHFEHAFDSEFLDELAMLAKIYRKMGL